MERQVIILMALALDLIFGDPPNHWHPTAWMGKLIGYAKKNRPWGNRGSELAYGGGLALGGAALAGGLAWIIERLLKKMPRPLGWLASAALLKTTFSLRGLDEAAWQIQIALERGNLPEARRLLAWHLVSRDTSQLDASRIAAATVESVAENASDSLVAPLFYYALGGLPLAFAYRFTNTADAMLGYHTGELEWLGKIPARLDDLLNLLPARLTGLLLALAAPVAGGRAARAFHFINRDAGKTASPNAGYPMSAMAGALDVELEKIGHYRLGEGSRRPQPADIRRSRKMLLATAGISTAILVIAMNFIGRFSTRKTRRKRNTRINNITIFP